MKATIIIILLLTSCMHKTTDTEHSLKTKNFDMDHLDSLIMAHPNDDSYKMAKQELQLSFNINN